MLPGYPFAFLRDDGVVAVGMAWMAGVPDRNIGWLESPKSGILAAFKRRWKTCREAGRAEDLSRHHR